MSGDRSHERFASVAESSFTLAADYEREFGNGAQLRLHVDYAWQDDMQLSEYNWAANPNNQAIIDATTAPAAGILGARATVAFNDEMFELAVFGRNITNNRAPVNALLVAPLGYIAQTRREPATYGVTATVRF